MNTKITYVYQHIEDVPKDSIISFKNNKSDSLFKCACASVVFMSVSHILEGGETGIMCSCARCKVRTYFWTRHYNIIYTIVARNDIKNIII